MNFESIDKWINRITINKEICLCCFSEKSKCNCFEEFMDNLRCKEYYGIENYLNR